MEEFSVEFDFYGVTAVITSESRDIIDYLRRDFEFFVRSGISQVIELRCSLKEIDYGGLGTYQASGYGKDNISFKSGQVKIVDYRGKALSIYDFSNETGEIIAPEKSRLYELAYLLLLSRVGELLDLKGMHRAHGFAVKSGSEGVLALLPEGGGKTTLFTSILGLEGIQALSDDTPILKGNTIFAFPTRVSMCETDAKDIPKESKREFIRTDRQTKYLVDLGYFNPKISDPVRLNKILVCRRDLSNTASITKASSIQAIWPLTRDMIFGLGVPQLVEHFLRNTPEDTLKKCHILAKRCWTAVILISHSKTFIFRMGLARDKNSQVLRDFLTLKDA